MRRRLLAALAALLLLLVGGAVLVAYVRGADARALAGVQTVEVLVADQPIPAGTPGEELKALVRREVLPEKAALPGRVTDLAELAGQTATVDVEPGEQLLASRVADPAAQQAPGPVAVPAGKSELSVLLEPQRVVGGQLAAGDTVGVYISLSFQDGSHATHGVLHRVLVTRVQGAPASADASGTQGETQTASSGEAAPTASVLVTLAVTAREAEAVVFGVEHGTLWLSLEPDGASTAGTEVINEGNIYGKAFQ
jgi:pilus assembly protein CpaB